MKTKRKLPTEINASSMADIAFLLLIFFLVTTTIAADKGLPQVLPPKNRLTSPTNDRNVLRVLVNARGLLLVEDNPLNINDLKEKIKEFIVNPSKNEKLSEGPLEAVISIKTDRGTKYAMFVRVLDEVKAAYHELRAEALGMNLTAYLRLDTQKMKPVVRQKYEATLKAFPMRISEAEPTKAVE